MTLFNDLHADAQPKRQRFSPKKLGRELNRIQLDENKPKFYEPCSSSSSDEEMMDETEANVVVEEPAEDEAPLVMLSDDAKAYFDKLSKEAPFPFLKR
ncbi:hypothetical protein L596_024628 [Steinernema carpocapsae]|nr:hypothetical protein L596_024628 [Steinernema carpocapsae]